MTTEAIKAARWRAGVLAAALVAGVGGYWIGQRRDGGTPGAESAQVRNVLYWYDPMVPQEKYDNPDSLSSMGMKTIPKFADEVGAAASPGVSVNPAAMQNLGIRVVAAEFGTLASGLTVTGSIEFSQRNVAVVQGLGYPNPNLSHFSSMATWMAGRFGQATAKHPGNPGAFFFQRLLLMQKGELPLQLLRGNEMDNANDDSQHYLTKNFKSTSQSIAVFLFIIRSLSLRPSLGTYF